MESLWIKSLIAEFNFFVPSGFVEFMVNFVWMKLYDTSLFIKIVLTATELLEGRT